MLFKSKNSIRLIRKFLLVMFCFVFLSVYPMPAEVYSLRLFDKADILFYTPQKPYVSCDYIQSGFNYEIRTNEKGAKHIRQNILPIYQTAIFYGDINAVLRCLKLSVKEKVKINGGTLYCGFSQIVKGRELKGVNVQVYEKNGKIYIGNPVIYGSY